MSPHNHSGRHDRGRKPSTPPVSLALLIAPVVEFAGARDRLSGVLLWPYAADGPSDVAQDWDDDRDTSSKQSCPSTDICAVLSKPQRIVRESLEAIF
jgi:hypothetical protein